MPFRVHRVAAVLARGTAALRHLRAVAGQREHLLAGGEQSHGLGVIEQERPRVVVLSTGSELVEPGTNVFFSSRASNLQSTVRSSVPFDRNGAGDVFFWSELSGNVSLQSRDSHNEILNNPGPNPPPNPAAAPTTPC